LPVISQAEVSAYLDLATTPRRPQEGGCTMADEGSAVRQPLGAGLEKLHIVYCCTDGQLLAGARRLFQAFRVPWKTDFVTDPVAAWQLIEQGSIHVLVAESRQHEYRGSLMEQVANMVPHVIRIALVPTAEDRRAFMLAGWAHQALVQPANAKTLLHEVRRCCQTANLLSNSYLSGLLTPLKELPSNNVALGALWSELRRPDPDVDRIASAVQQDPALSGQVLRLANSPLFSPASSVCSLPQALVMLGLSRLRSLVLYLSAFAAVDDEVVRELDLDSWHSNTQRLAQLGVQIAMQETTGSSFRDNVLVAGILQDIGVLALATVEPERYIPIFTCDPVALRKAEIECFGVSHAEVGAFLLGLWHMPMPVVEGVLGHHAPSPYARPDFDVAAVLYSANIFSELAAGQLEENQIDSEYFLRIDKSHRVEYWRRLAESA
jgi:HD-like signal output (HDOD) protein